ncbi:hypothetical protein PYCC9005_002377 [Savitreella phatthalungensis]
MPTFKDRLSSFFSVDQPPTVQPSAQRTTNMSKSSYDAEVAERDASAQGDFSETSSIESKSAGVKRVEVLAGQFSNTEIILLLLAIFVFAYGYDLDGTIRYTYQSYATSSFAQLGLLSTVNVLRSVIGAAAQPTYAKLADVFGRFEILMVAIGFYIIGTIIEATSNGLRQFAAGVIIYQIGFSGVLITVTVIIADFVSLRYRVLGTFVPLMPYIVNVWISGNVTAAVLGRTTWHWGMGMWAIIIPVIALPMLAMLAYNGYKARGQLPPGPFHKMTPKNFIIELFWLLDVVGVILMIAVLACILVPLTLAGGVSSTWQKGHIIAPLVVGFVLIPVFVLWELKGARKPVVPFDLLRDRGVWAALGIAVIFDWCWYMQGDYLYTVLVVSFGESILSATRISSLYTFVSTLTGTIVGMVVALPRVQRVKPFILFGTFMWLPAFALLIYYRGHGTSRAGIIAAQVLLGFGAGFFTYPTLTSAQAATKHENLAVITGLYLALFYVGSGIGSAVSGAVYTNVLPGRLQSELAKVTSNTTIATLVYGSALTVAPTYPLGSPIRDAIVEAYKHVQVVLCGVGMALVVPLIIFACFLRDPKLVGKQSLK